MAYTPTEWENGELLAANKFNKMEAGIRSANSSYVPTEWAPGDVITAEALNKIENGIAAAGGGGGATAEEKDVNFIDYDGTILYSYTAQEFAALNALPALVSHEGMAAATAWNWTLADAKTCVVAVGKLWIGQEYENTEVDFELNSKGLKAYVQFIVNGSVTVDWGDGTTNTYTGTSSSSVKTVGHTWPANGKYIIKFVPSQSTTYFRLGGSTTSCVVSSSAGATDWNATKCLAAMITGIRMNVNARPGMYALQSTAIKSITFPKGDYTSTATGVCQNCGLLKNISFPSNLTTISDSSFYGCGLRKVELPNCIISLSGSYAFAYCLQLNEVLLPPSLTTLGSQAMMGAYAIGRLTCLATTPPSYGTQALELLDGTNAGGIYVPYSDDHSVLAAYKSAWRQKANAIVELPA